MIFMRKFIFTLTCLLSVMTFYGQDLPKIVPPSPEAASLGKFTDVPVTLNNGAANISVPIHTIGLKGISIPISLSYHTRGVKVDEIASRVGIGWALNFGGIISRTTLDKPDDGGRWGYLKKDFGSDLVNEQAQQAIFNDYCASNGALDLESDIFNLNMAGTSATFYFEQTDINNPVLKEFDDIKITAKWENGIIVGFIAKDTAGNTFYFGQSKDGTKEYFSEKEVNNSSVYRTTGGIEYGIGSEEINKTYNAWHLIEIETIYGEKVEFIYEAETVNYVSKFYDSYIPQSPDSPDAWLNGWRPINESQKQCMFSLIRERQYQLSEIKYGLANSTRLNKILFNKSSTERQDLQGSFALESIEIKDGHDKLIKSYDLNYTYSHNTVTSGYLNSLAQLDSRSHYRLMLSSVQQKDQDNNTLPPYSFEYDSQTLPNRFSNSKDVWGYYNGHDNGQFLTLNPYNIFLQPNREIDLDKSEAGILKKVTYPTGGYSIFTYEHNVAKPSYDMDQFLTYDFNPTKQGNVGLSHIEYSTNYDGYIYTKPFTVNNIIREKVTANVWFDDETSCLSNAWERGCKFRVTIASSTGNSIIELFKGNRDIILPNGNYILKVEPKDDAHTPLDINALDGFGVALNWRESLADTNDLVYGPGKRIQKVEFFDSNGETISAKEYEYTKPDGTSSGVLIGLPDFYSVAALSQPNFQFHTGVMAGSKTNIHQSNQVAYSDVTEYIGKKNQNAGKTRYEFTTYLDGGSFYKFPYHTPNDNEWLRGKNLKTEYYKYDTSTQSYTIEKEVINKYLYANTPDNPGIILGDIIGANFSTRTTRSNGFIKFVPIYTRTFFDNIVGGHTGNLYHAVNVEFCDINGNVVHSRTAGTLDLLSTTELNYLNGNIVETQTRYSYDYDNHYQLKNSETTDSKGDVYKTESDYNSTLVAENRMQPVTSTTFKNGEKLAVQHTNYERFGSILLPSQVQTSTRDQLILEDRVIYHKYDSNGNPETVSKKDGTVIHYIWGYDKTQPIAKIEGEKCPRIYQPDKRRYVLSCTRTPDQNNAITNAINASNVDNDDLSLISHPNEEELRLRLSNLRDKFPNAFVTTYTYNPLIGVTSITDPRGETTYYFYDKFNRLQFIKDSLGNILKENKYNYKN